MDEKYSVLMSLYNGENSDYLKLSIESMLNQTIIPDEILVVEDGPLSEELKKVLKYYQEKYKDIFHTLPLKKNLGLGLALNEGLKVCKNNLVARMDTDDISLKDRCEKQLKEFSKDKNLSLLGSNINEFVNNPQKIKSVRKVPSSYEEILKFAKRRNAFNHPTVMYKKDVILKYGGYSNFKKNQDFELFGRLLLKGVKAKNINESLVLFRANDQMYKRRKSLKNLYYSCKVSYSLWKQGFSKFGDFLIYVASQFIMFLLPTRLQKIIYKNVLRRRNGL